MHLAPLWRAPVDAADIDGLALPNGGVDLIVLVMSADPDVGWHLLSKVRKTWAASRVLFLSDIVPLEVPLGGLSDGVVGCLSKFAPLADLEASFHLVARGHQVGVRGYRQVPPALPAGVPGNGIAPPYRRRRSSMTGSIMKRRRSLASHRGNTKYLCCLPVVIHSR